MAEALLTARQVQDLALLRQLRDPEVRRGLARMLELLRSVGTETT